MEFADRNEFEIQGIVGQILKIAANGLKWANERESARLDGEEDVVELAPGDKNDEGYLIEELAEALPTHLSIIKTILLLRSEPVGSDEENIALFAGLLSDRKITHETVFHAVAACCDFYAFGWMARHIAGPPPFRHYRAAGGVTSPVASNGQFEESEIIAAVGGGD